MFYVFLFQNLCFTYVFILSILVLFAYRYSFRLWYCNTIVVGKTLASTESILFTWPNQLNLPLHNRWADVHHGSFGGGYPGEADLREGANVLSLRPSDNGSSSNKSWARAETINYQSIRGSLTTAKLLSRPEAINRTRKPLHVNQVCNWHANFSWNYYVARDWARLMICALPTWPFCACRTCQ